MSLPGSLLPLRPQSKKYVCTRFSFTPLVIVLLNSTCIVDTRNSLAFQPPGREELNLRVSLFALASTTKNYYSPLSVSTECCAVFISFCLLSHLYRHIKSYITNHSIPPLTAMKHATKPNGTSKNSKRLIMASVLSLLAADSPVFAFAPSPQITSVPKQQSSTQLHHWATRLDRRFEEPTEIRRDPQPEISRRSIISTAVIGTTLATLLSLLPANADFAPGGPLLDRTVSVTFGNSEASPSRAKDNSNVLFNQDNYYKFGAAAQWIEPGSTEFPKTMPFAPRSMEAECNLPWTKLLKLAAHHQPQTFRKPQIQSIN
jgi:hypothetical protein